MANWKEIKRRIKSIKNTAKITKAMELISTVKMKKAQDLALEKKAYITWVLKVIMNLNESLSKHAFFKRKSDSNKTLAIIITSNKWLCGGYNINVMKKLNSYIKETGEELDFISVWKRWAQFVARTWNNVVADFSNTFSDNINFPFSKQISRLFIEKFLSEWYSKVVVFYNYYVNTIRQIPVSREILPLTDESIDKYFSQVLGSDYKKEVPVNMDYNIEPNITDLINEVLPMLLDAMFYDILLESKASEHSARMIAMKNAKDNANKYAQKLLLEYNKARQASITKEVSEIVSGVESMKD